MARRESMVAADEPGRGGCSTGLQISGASGLMALDSDFLVSGDMELQAGASTLEEEPLELSACGLVAHGGESGGCGQEDDLDMNFLSDFLQPGLLPTSNESGDSSPTADSLSSDGADNSSSTEDSNVGGGGAGASKRAKKSLSSASSSASLEIVEAEQEGRLVDRKARRRAQVASSARRLRCRKKNEMVTLKAEATFLEQQLKSLRIKHKQMRANNEVAAWEERAIAQRYKRRQAEMMNEKLRQALFMQSGFVRNLRSMFSEAMPCSIELNMRNFLHTPTRLLNDPHSRVRNLERVCTDAKLDMAKQIIMEETGGIKPWTTPHIACQQIDLGRDGFGMTTVAVYALETRNACKTFKAACSAIMNCTVVWPNYTLVTSSLKSVDLPPTKLNIRYGMSHNIYQSDATGDRVSVESREISYCRMTEDCGIFLWDYVDADDMNPLQKDTTAMRCTIGAVLVRPEICMDGVERIVCRNICTKTHMVDFSGLTPTLERFSKSRQLCARICGSLVYESIRSEAATP
ncbi:hypothetical protein PF010_g236 [Phytophthora fragariae]|uniref:BZIP domain-containing protein n=1 Tax=Phytophthora fragariae TaxID=53985 RepID=A0A6G0M3K3_9STRA|nr:hypothetical protein PF010_g236 [Phytophthora fragariae]KAE9256177.1 hypothetical protein PF004_g213 [Phytophthora fragariae]